MDKLSLGLKNSIDPEVECVSTDHTSKMTHAMSTPKIFSIMKKICSPNMELSPITYNQHPQSDSYDSSTLKRKISSDMNKETFLKGKNKTPHFFEDQHLELSNLSDVEFIGNKLFNPCGSREASLMSSPETLRKHHSDTSLDLSPIIPRKKPKGQFYLSSTFKTIAERKIKDKSSDDSTTKVLNQTLGDSSLITMEQMVNSRLHTPEPVEKQPTAKTPLKLNAGDVAMINTAKCCRHLSMSNPSAPLLSATYNCDCPECSYNETMTSNKQFDSKLINESINNIKSQPLIENEIGSNLGKNQLSECPTTTTQQDDLCIDRNLDKLPSYLSSITSPLVKLSNETQVDDDGLIESNIISAIQPLNDVWKGSPSWNQNLADSKTELKISDKEFDDYMQQSSISDYVSEDSDSSVDVRRDLLETKFEETTDIDLMSNVKNQANVSEDITTSTDKTIDYVVDGDDSSIKQEYKSENSINSSTKSLDQSSQDMQDCSYTIGSQDTCEQSDSMQDTDSDEDSIAEINLKNSQQMKNMDIHSSDSSRSDDIDSEISEDSIHLVLSHITEDGNMTWSDISGISPLKQSISEHKCHRHCKGTHSNGCSQEKNNTSEAIEDGPSKGIMMTSTPINSGQPRINNDLEISSLRSQECNNSSSYLCFPKQSKFTLTTDVLESFTASQPLGDIINIDEDKEYLRKTCSQGVLMISDKENRDPHHNRSLSLSIESKILKHNRISPLQPVENTSKIIPNDAAVLSYGLDGSCDIEALIAECSKNMKVPPKKCAPIFFDSHDIAADDTLPLNMSNDKAGNQLPLLSSDKDKNIQI